jgi:serine palmitoyltransferase
LFFTNEHRLLAHLPPDLSSQYLTGLVNHAQKRYFRSSAMDLQETQRLLSEYLHELADLFHRVPGSAIFLRYVKSSYQDDPIRSAVELFLFLFAVRYLLAPKYSTKPGVVPLTEDEIDDLVDEWTPEPLVGKPTSLEEMEVDKRTVIVG